MFWDKLVVGGELGGGVKWVVRLKYMFWEKRYSSGEMDDWGEIGVWSKMGSWGEMGDWSEMGVWDENRWLG